MDGMVPLMLDVLVVMMLSYIKQLPLAGPTRIHLQEKALLAEEIRTITSHRTLSSIAGAGPLKQF